ncbi:hypothetical protein [Flavobacterium sp. N1736]|uniref:hypothetical protein n=1 Tax=Flavobacterium sp. N1736 TaxID=2986823 RepID=UPI00222440C2|nr:hypothetical protein [Flavobacterium sp. N1736]
MKKLKKLAKTVFVLSFTLLITNCTKEEIGEKQSFNQERKINEAKNWFNVYKTNEPLDSVFKSIDYHWENASEIKLENDSIVITVPVKDNPQNPEYKGEKRLYLYPFGKEYRPVIHELFPDSEAVFKQDQTKDDFGSLNFYNGYILTWDLKEGFVKGAKFENGIAVNNVKARFLSGDDKIKPRNLTGKEAPIPLDEVIVQGGSGGSSNPIGISRDFSIGSSVGGIYGTGGYISSGGGSNNGDGSTNSSNSATYAPPSCESFYFVRKNGANWQEALVKNVSFKIVLVTQKGFRITQIIDYPQPISFGIPVNFNKGNGDVTVGVAATVSAKILELAMRETITKYGNTEVSELSVRLYFQKKLIDEYRLYTNGGIVNFNSTSTIKATNYKTNTSSTGNCD